MQAYQSIGADYSRALAAAALQIAIETYQIGDDGAMVVRRLREEGFSGFTFVYNCQLVSDGVCTDNAAREKAVFEEGRGTTRAVAATAEKEGATIVLVAFSGTNYDEDWLINLSAKTIDHKHAGFDKNCREFLAMDDTIMLPAMEKSLRAVCRAARSNPAIRFFVVGHSMGAAIAQLYVAEGLMGRYGIPKEQIGAYAFASPCPVDKHYISDPTIFPVFNIINTDDIVTRTGPVQSMLTGAGRHLGKELVYTPTTAFRKKCYFRSGIHQSAALVLPRPFCEIINYVLDTHELIESYKTMIEENLIIEKKNKNAG